MLWGKHMDEEATSMRMLSLYCRRLWWVPTTQSTGGVAQNVEDRIADALAAIEVEAVVVLNLIGHIDDIAQHRR